MPHNTFFLCGARTSALYCGIHELIVELEARIEDGETFDNQKLTGIAERHFDGTRAEGRYTLFDVYDALGVAVNNYLLENHARELMRMDVCDAFSSVLRPLLRRLPPQTDGTLEQELQQLSSPTLAYFLARLLDANPTDIVLEPSAGTGSLAIWPHAIGARVICNETNSLRNSLLRCVFNFDTLPLDAEFIDELLPRQMQPTAVLMNTPFFFTSRGGIKRNIYEARYIASALRRLQDGGRLVALVSEGMSFNDPSLSEWWQRIACLCNIRANLTLDRKAYSRCVAAPDLQILTVDKTGPTPGTDWHEQLNHIRRGRAATIEQAWESLQYLVEPTKPTDDPQAPNSNSFGQSTTDIERMQLALNFS